MSMETVEVGGKEMGSLLDLVLGHPNSSLSEQGLCW
jgi:hypothetical protein